MRAIGLLVVLAACGASDDPCKGVTGTCKGLSEGASASDVEKALIEIAPGGTVAFGAGTFDFKVGLSLSVDNVTIQGAGMDKTILSFAHQTDGAQGLLVTANGFTMHDIAVENTKGDAVKILGGDRITLQRTRVEWTAGPNETNGSYGLYPVQCKHVLIEDCVVKGASDSGVYVGQSDQIIVQHNDVELNVAGIEIENSTHADVHDNVATKNTGGILVFNLPGLEVHNGAGTRVYNNQSYDNNTNNFAPAGNIVGLVPTGTGIAILAAHQIEIFGNQVHDHKTVNVGVISYVPTGIAVTDPNYDEYPTAISIHDNTLTGTSDMPTGQLGGLLISALGELYPQGPFIVPDIAWDGVKDPARVQQATGDYLADDKICIQHNGDADFIDLAWPLADATKPTTDMTPHDCAHTPLPEVATW
ncbi:MAG: right-handed parallel beta-helix repeat-containing protein [Deltaproteobacteria bacterium]|nr:right-handed parallel beta-helix repeat-containing protein [Deltaproteobacteria bacterium]